MDRFRLKTEEEMKDPAEMRNMLSNEVYELGCAFFERVGEHGGLLRGNGHHMAQSLTTAALEIWDKHLKEIPS